MDMEFFSCLLNRVVNGGYLPGWREKRRSGVNISLAVSVPCGFPKTILFYLGCLLILFKACFELKIKLEQRELIPLGRVDDLSGVVSTLGYKEGTLPFSYLGLPLGPLLVFNRA